MMLARTAGIRGALQAKWGFLSAKRPPDPRPMRLPGPRRHEEHAVDLVSRRLVLEAVRDAPDAAEAPFEEVGGVLEDEPLDLDVNFGALLLIQRGTPLDDQVRGPCCSSSCTPRRTSSRHRGWHRRRRRSSTPTTTRTWAPPCRRARG